MTRTPVLADVAAAAGVSLSTVSRVITGRTPVSARTRERVEAAVRALDYRPNAAAQALVSGKSTMVAVIAKNTLRWGYAATIQGIEEAARSTGYTILIGVAETDEPSELLRVVNSVVTRSLAGAVVIDFDQVGAATLAAMPSIVPIVAAAGASQPADRWPHAYLDDFEGGRMATEHLLALGHRTVHHVAIPSTRERSGREWGWRHALQAAGREVPPVVRAEYDPESGHDVTDRLGDDVTAILCGNDELAIGVIRGLTERGVAVPRQISVMGFDDQPFAAMWTPALTTVRQDFHGLGRRTFGLLQEWIETGVRPADSMAVPEIVVRESTAPPLG